MAVEHAVVGQALGLGGDHVLFVDLVEKAVLGQQGHGCKVTDHQGGDGQRQVPEVVGDLAAPAQLVEVVGGEPAQGEPVEITAAGKQHDQQDRKQERRDRIADDDQRTGPHVEMAAMPGGLGDPQRDRHQVHDQRAPQPEGNGHRHFFLDEVDDLGIAEEAVAKIQRGVVLHHDPQAFRRRLVEAVHLLDFLDQRRVQALGATVAAGTGHRDFGSAAGDAAGGAFKAFELGDHLLDRATGGGLDDDEVDQQDPEQRGDDQ